MCKGLQNRPWFTAVDVPDRGCTFRWDPLHIRGGKSHFPESAVANAPAATTTMPLFPLLSHCFIHDLILCFLADLEHECSVHVVGTIYVTGDLVINLCFSCWLFVLSTTADWLCWVSPFCQSWVCCVELVSSVFGLSCLASLMGHSLTLLLQ